MESDSIISSVQVTTDRLLAIDRATRSNVPEIISLAPEQALNVNHAVLVISVELHKTKSTMRNLHLF